MVHEVGKAFRELLQIDLSRKRYLQKTTSEVAPESCTKKKRKEVGS